MRAQRSRLLPARLALIALLLASITLPLIPVQQVFAAPIMQTNEAVANRVAEVRRADPTIEEDFESDDDTWGRMYTGISSIYFKSGKLHVSTDDTEQVVWSNRDGTFTDFYLEIDAEFYAGNEDSEVGVIFRYLDEDNFYYFGVDGYGNYVIQLLYDGEWYDVIEWDDSSLIELGQGAVNRLGLLVEGAAISILINDYVMATTEDETFEDGGIGLSAVTYSEGGVDMAYDNFQLWDLDEAGNRQPVRVPQRPSSETPTPEATPTATVPPTAVGPVEENSATTIRAGEPTYQETFDEEPEGWLPLQADGLNYSMAAGDLDITITRADALGWTVLPTAPTDYYMEVDTLFLGDVAEAEYGILFRYQDSQNFNLFAVNNNGYYSIWRLVDNSWGVLYDWEQTDVLAVGDSAENRLGLLVQEDLFTVFVNDRELMTVQDDFFEGGNLALAAGTFGEPNIDVIFDNVTLWSLDPAAQRPERPEADGTPTAESTPEATAEPTEEPSEEPTATPEPGDLPLTTELEEAIFQLTEELEPTAQDDFNRDRGNWRLRTNESSRAFLDDSALQIEINEVDWYQWSSYIGGQEDPLEFTNFYAQVTTFYPAVQPGAAAGIAFRVVDPDNYYLYLVTEAGRYALFVQEDGEWTTLIDYTTSDVFATDADALNVMGVLADGETIALTINMQVVDVVQDATHASGGLALAGESRDDPGVIVGFDDFMLWEDE